MVLSPETFPGYLNYVYYTTVKKVSKRGQRDTSIKKKNRFRNNNLKSPATSTSYPEEYKAALTPNSKNIIHQQPALISTLIMHAMCKVCIGAYLNIFVLERLPITKE